MIETPSDVAAGSAEALARRARWTAALRSGGYAQAREALRVDRSDGTPAYCCLGVAEDVRGATWIALGPVEASEVYGTHEIYDPALDHDEALALTPTCRRWYGLAEVNPYVAYRGGPGRAWVAEQLSVLNDDHKLSLAAIADVLDDQPPGWTGAYHPVFADVVRRNADADLPPSEEDS